MKTALLSLILLSAFSIEAVAKNCRNSQPCGNSCISWSKTCRIGSGSSYTPQPVRVAPQRAAQSAPSSSAAQVPAAEAAARSAQNEQRPQLVMPKTDAAFIMDAPSRTANRIRRLRMDETFTVYQRLDGWVRVSPSGRSAEWVLADFLTP